MKNISNIRQTLKRKILVVEDEFINQQILGNIISINYEPIYANNGKEALDQLYKNDKISLILLDLNMPIMDGFEFLEQIKNTPFSRIPIIVLTAEKSAEIKSLGMGAQDFIVKPYDMPEIILARISRSILLAEESEMIEKTARDNLTKLFTQKYFFEYIDEFNQLNEDVEMDAISIDIRHFSFINEIYGYTVGDKILVSLANTLKGLFEKNQGITSRISGDKFYLYINHLDDYEELLKTLLDGVSIEELGDYHIEMMLGINPKCNKNEGARKAFDRALKAGHLLDDDHSRSINIYDEKMYQKEQEEEMMILEFDKAIKEKQFKIYLQPKINIKGDKFILEGAEALVRWISPTRGFINPGLFIPVLEENGLIYKLDQYIWNEAAKQVKKFKDEFHKTVPISVNVSRIDILSPNFVKDIQGIVKNNGIENKDLHLEVTESAYSTQVENILNIVKTLHNLGFIIEIDDFGTGYSSLSLISSIAFDIMKIDMSFVRNMFKSEKDLKIIELMFNITKTLNVKTVAEGVEDDMQVNKLKEMGCDYIQGYYFSKPIPIDEFIEKYLKD